MTRLKLTKHAAVIAALMYGLAVASPAQARPLTVEATPVYLNPEDIQQTSVGRLQFVTGLRLTSQDSQFGGLSGHEILADDSWLAVTDTGRWLSGRLRFDAKGAVTGLEGLDIAELNASRGTPLPRTADKRWIDSEAIRLAPDGSILVSFELKHRIYRYSAENRLAGGAIIYQPPEALVNGPRNGGLEAIAPLPDGRILAITEDLRDTDNRLMGWLIDGDRWQVLYLQPTGIFKPTDMVALPAGDVLLLERRYTISGGPGARVSLIRANDIKPSTTLRSETLAELALPMSVDNFEGLAVRSDGAGGWHLFLLSDDNFNPLQRTLLLQFHLPAQALAN